MYSLGIDQIDVPTHISVLNKMVEFYEMTPGGRGSTLEIEFFPTQAVLAVPDAETAYPWRSFKANM